MFICIAGCACQLVHIFLIITLAKKNLLWKAEQRYKSNYCQNNVYESLFRQEFIVITNLNFLVTVFMITIQLEVVCTN